MLLFGLAAGGDATDTYEPELPLQQPRKEPTMSITTIKKEEAAATPMIILSTLFPNSLVSPSFDMNGSSVGVPEGWSVKSSLKNCDDKTNSSEQMGRKMKYKFHNMEKITASDGATVGSNVGFSVGTDVGVRVGSRVGDTGAAVGSGVGWGVGNPVGETEALVGTPVGSGFPVGRDVGIPVGETEALVGTPVGSG